MAMIRFAPISRGQYRAQPDRAAVQARGLESVAAVGQVPSEAKNDPMTNWPGSTVITSLPTASTTPQYSWPNGIGLRDRVQAARNSHRSDPQTQVAALRTITSVGAWMVGSGKSSVRTSPAP